MSDKSMRSAAGWRAKGMCPQCGTWVYLPSVYAGETHCGKQLLHVQRRSWLRAWIAGAGWLPLARRRLSPAYPSTGQPADSLGKDPTVTLWVQVEDKGTGGTSVNCLGEWHAAIEDGIPIGSDPTCKIVLAHDPQIAPLHATYVARGHHRFLQVDPERPVRFMGKELSPGLQRVDYQPFSIGRYIVRFAEAEEEI